MKIANEKNPEFFFYFNEFEEISTFALEVLLFLIAKKCSPKIKGVSFFFGHAVIVGNFTTAVTSGGQSRAVLFQKKFFSRD